MGDKYGTANVKKVLDLVVELANVVGLSIRDGKITTGNVALLLDEVFALKDFDLEQFKFEFAELSADERSELLEHLKVKFDLPNDAVEARIERGAFLASRLVELVPEFISFGKGLREEVVVVKKRKKKSESKSD